MQETELNDIEREPEMLSRVIRLEGMEEGINKGFKEEMCVDTADRLICIAGTSREDMVGKGPSSLDGTIFMLNKDILELYDMIDVSNEINIFQETIEGWCYCLYILCFELF